MILWNAATGRKAAVLNGERSGVSAVAFSPDGMTLASLGAGPTVRLWDVHNGKSLATLQGPTRTELAACLAFSPDGKLVASGDYNNTILFWDVATKENIAVIKVDGPTIVFSIAFSPDGKILAVGTGNDVPEPVFGVSLWDVGSRKAIASLKGHTGSIRAVAFSADGRLLASASSDWTVRLWDVASRKNIGTLRETGPVNARFGPDGKVLIVCDFNGTINVWDVRTQKVAFSAKAEEAALRCLALRPDGEVFATGASESSVQIWRLKKK